MINWDYIAGFFDGEGCVTNAWRIHQEDSGYFVLSASITQCGPEGKIVLEKIRLFLKNYEIRSSVHGGAYTLKEKRRNKEKFRLDISHRNSLLIFFRNLLPYLEVKKVIVQDTLRYLVRFPSINGRLKGLNFDRESLKRDRASGVSLKVLADKYGISFSAACDCVYRPLRKFPFLMMTGGKENVEGSTQ